MWFYEALREGIHCHVATLIFLLDFLSGEIVPGKVWTAKLGGGLDRKFHWVERQRLTAEEVKNKVMYQEKVIH